MLSTLTIVLPIFALIIVGWLARRVGILGPHATRELNRFVVYLALPALLFDIVANTHWSDIWQPGFIAAFGLSAILTYALTVVIGFRRHRSLADASIEGLNAGYGNTGFVGLPLAIVALGQDALAPTMVATIITVCFMFAIAIILVEVGLQSEQRRVDIAAKVGKSLIRNPLLIAPALGGLVSLSRIGVPTGVETFLKLLGGSASPCALIALGLFLAHKRPARGGDTGSAAILTSFKLLFQPALAWILATFVFSLPPILTHTAVLLAALPTGTGPFMLAELYSREATVTSATILISTTLSIITVSTYLAWGR